MAASGTIPLRRESAIELPAELMLHLAPFLSRESGPGPLDDSGSFQAISLAGIREAAAFLGCSHTQAMVACLARGLWPLRFKNNRGLLTACQQAKLLQSHVAVIGCGGLGGHVILLLARLGIGALTLCDNDIFEESNLNRQLLCREDRLGMNKALAAQAEVALTASHVAVQAFTEAATPASLPAMLAECHLVVDCLDTLTVRRQVEQATYAAGIPFIHGTIAGLEGFAMVCPPPSSDEEQESGLSRLYGSEDVTKADSSEARAGVPTPTPAVTSVLQIMLVLRELLDTPALQPTRRLWHIDLAVPEIEVLSV